MPALMALLPLLSRLALRLRSTVTYSSDRPGRCWCTAGGLRGGEGTIAGVLPHAPTGAGRLSPHCGIAHANAGCLPVQGFW